MSHTQLRLWAATFWAIAILLLSSCTTDSPYRFTSVDPPYKTTDCKAENFKNGPPNEIGTCFSASVEHTDKYTLFFIEFDEQGRFYDRKQLIGLKDYLDSRRPDPNLSIQPKNNGISIVTFVHGWRNNSRFDNSNVKLARKTLEFTYASENSGTHYNPSMNAREVVGIYVGWRGASISLSDLKNNAGFAGDIIEGLSVLDRKNTAQTVAVGSVRELFSTVKVYQDIRNIDAEKNKECARTFTNYGDKIAHELKEKVYQCKPIRHLIVGHSFGALIVNNAISQQLLDNVTQGVFSDPKYDCKPQDNGMPGRSMVNSYADLVILLNPAVEGARYEPLHAVNVERGRKDPYAAKTAERKGAYCPEQKPVLVVLSSSFDFPNKKLFPIVRTITTVFESNQPRHDAYTQEEGKKAQEYISDQESISSRNTMGFNDRYASHELMGWEKFTEKYHQENSLEKNNTYNQSATINLKKYAENLRNSCNKPHPIETSIDSLESRLLWQRCMSSKDADTMVNNIKPESTFKDMPINPKEISCFPFVSDINLAKMLGARNSQNWPEEIEKSIKNNPKPNWLINFSGGTVLRHIQDKSNTLPKKYLVDRDLHSEQSPYGPLWMIHVNDKSIMANHNDIGIDGENFRGRVMLLLQQIYHSVVIKSFDPEVLRGFNALAAGYAKDLRCSK